MFALVHSLKQNRRLLRDLVSRDLRARYVGSSMGFFWSVIVPIVLLLVYFFVFTTVLKQRWADQQGKSEIALLMLAGILIWQAFAESVSRMTNALVENQNLIQKVVFPSEVLPVYLTVSALVNMLLGLVVALLGVVYVGYVREPTDAAAGQLEALWSDTGGSRAVAGNGLFHANTLRCATAQAEIDGLTVRDDSSAPWSLALRGHTAGGSELGAPGDHVYLDDHTWGIVLNRIGDAFTVDRWRPVEVGETERGAVRPVVVDFAPGAAVNGTSAPKSGAAQAKGLHRAVVVRAPSRPLVVTGWLAALVPLVLLQGVFMLGVGYLLAVFNLFLRDTYHVIGVALLVWMFATPIFYPANLVDKAGFGWVLRANPMYWLIESYREVLVYGSAPNWADVGLFALVAFALLFLGAKFFMTQKPRFPDLL